MNQPLDPRILRVAEVLDTHDVTPQQAIILATCCAEAPPKMTALSERCGISTAAMTGSIDRLESLGWVQRTRQGDDRRSISIILTPVGEAIVTKLNNAISTL